MTAFALRAHALAVRREHFTLDVPELVAGADGTAIVGPNGAGKTTLLLALQGMLASSGTIERPARCAGVFAKPAFLRGSAQWNISALLRAHGVDRQSAEQRTALVLERVGLAENGAQDSRRLSSGQQQRLALARALVLEPQALFLDEAFANVDADARVALRTLVREYVEQNGCALVVATQSFADISALCRRIVLLEAGNVATVCGIDETRSSEAPYLRALVREADF